MSLATRLVQELSEYGVAAVMVDRDAVLHGERVVQLDLVMTPGQDPPTHVFTFARRNKMSDEQMIAVIRSYLPVPETGMTEDETWAAVVDERMTLAQAAESLGLDGDEATQRFDEWEP